MKVEILETIKHGTDTFVKDEQRNVDDALGAYFCGAGWARDLSGEVPTGERDTKAVHVAPDPAVLSVKTKATGGA